MESSSTTIRTLLDAKARRLGYFLTEAEVVQQFNRVIVNIPADARVATTNPERTELSRHTNIRWRWSQGGALFILQLADMTVVPMRLRDAGAPSWGGHYTAPSGLAGAPDEWVEPHKVALREGFEEVIIATSDGLVVPYFEEAQFNPIAWGAVASGVDLIRKEPLLPEIFRTGKLIQRRAKLRHGLYERDIVVQFDGEECSMTKAYPVFDPGTRGIDVMYIVEVDLTSYNLDAISIYCGE